MSKLSGRTYFWLAIYLVTAIALTIIIVCRDHKRMDPVQTPNSWSQTSQILEDQDHDTEHGAAYLFAEI